MYKITLKIDGMKCGMCESHINNIIRNNFKIKKVSSSHRKNETLIITKKIIEEDDLKTCINKHGYKVLDVSCISYQQKSIFSFLKK